MVEKMKETKNHIFIPRITTVFSYQEIPDNCYEAFRFQLEQTEKNELDENTVISTLETTASDGKNYQTRY